MNSDKAVGFDSPIEILSRLKIFIFSKENIPKYLQTKEINQWDCLSQIGMTPDVFPSSVMIILIQSRCKNDEI